MFGYNISADITLPALPVDQGPSKGTINIRATTRASTTPTWIHNWLGQQGSVEARLAHHADGYALEFPDYGMFYVSGDNISYAMYDDVSTNMLQHLLLDQVIPRTIAQRGNLVLHGSGVVINDQATLFIGASGAGKSTLATYLTTNGQAFISDDALYIDGITIHPSSPTSRLCGDSLENLTNDHDLLADEEDKTRLDINLAASTTTICAIFLLSRQDQIRLQPSSKAADLARIVSQSFALDITDHKRVTTNLALAQSLLNNVAVYRLGIPHRYSQLSDVRAAIMSVL